MLPQLIPQKSGGSRKCRTSSVRWVTTAFLGSSRFWLFKCRVKNVIILFFYLLFFLISQFCCRINDFCALFQVKYRMAGGVARTICHVDEKAMDIEHAKKVSQQVSKVSDFWLSQHWGILRLLIRRKFWAQGAKATFMQQFRSTVKDSREVGKTNISIILNISSCFLQMLLLWHFAFEKKVFKAGSLFTEVNIFFLLMIEWPTCWSVLSGVI